MNYTCERDEPSLVPFNSLSVGEIFAYPSAPDELYVLIQSRAPVRLRDFRLHGMELPTTPVIPMVQVQPATFTRGV